MLGERASSDGVAVERAAVNADCMPALCMCDVLRNSLFSVRHVFFSSSRRRLIHRACVLGGSTRTAPSSIPARKSVYNTERHLVKVYARNRATEHGIKQQQQQHTHWLEIESQRVRRRIHNLISINVSACSSGACTPVQ